MEKQHESVIQKILSKEFNQTSVSITRAEIGICNEVYLVELRNQSMVVRLNEKDGHLRGSDRYIPLFRSKGISVPEILARDYSKSHVPYCYQVQSRILGYDIRRVMASLTDTQRQKIAIEIANIVEALRDIPTDGRFGWVGANGKGRYASWTEEIAHGIERDTERGRQTGVLDDSLHAKYERVATDYSTYFDSVKSEFYFDDMNSKNVMIHKGVFTGLVDLDGVTFGDPLELVGRIKASWYGTSYGAHYTDAVMDALNLDAHQRAIVTVYCLINRINWLCETGIQFNANTTTQVDWKKVKQNKTLIGTLLDELKKGTG